MGERFFSGMHVVCLAVPGREPISAGSLPQWLRIHPRRNESH